MSRNRVMAVFLALWGATMMIAATVKLFTGEPPEEYRLATGLLLLYAAELRWKGIIN